MQHETDQILQLLCRGEISAVLTDSRSLIDGPGSVFFALRTESNDGHNYIGQLIDRGVRHFVVDHIPQGFEAIGVNFYVVDDVFAALRQMAMAYRTTALASTRFIAVSGSRGKSVVKEWMAQSLGAPHSPRSYNSQLGVPLSILSIPAGAQFAVIEAGISREGEMARLAGLIRPEVVLITGVSDAEHCDGFADFRHKVSEKLILGQEARVVVFPSSIEDEAYGFLPKDVTKVSVAIPQDALWLEADGMLAAETLRTVGHSLAPEVVRPLKTRLNVSQGVNNCLIASDRFTCDMHSLPTAIDFVKRRAPLGMPVTLVIDRIVGDVDNRLLHTLLDKEIVNRLIAVGEGYDDTLFRGKSRRYGDGSELLRSLSVSDFSSEFILAKGEEGGAVDTLARRLEARHNETVLEVNLDAVVHNFNHFKAMLRPQTGVVCMVKASAYGAGSLELARTLQDHGAAYLAVAVVDEGEELRRAGITMPIMALNPKVTNYDSLFANSLEPEIFSFEMLEEVIAEAGKRDIRDYPIHIKFDTGMHRLGFLRGDIDRLCRSLAPQVRVASVFSHLATADCLDMDDYTLSQLEQFSAICRDMSQRLPYGFKRHILNSAGIARFPQYQFDMVRLGISLYGVDTLGIPATSDLRPVSALRSIIISLKQWDAGRSIGYGCRTILDHNATIATIPVGYADGLNRRLSNMHGQVWVNGILCPIVGNICMDACMVDVTAAPDVKLGTQVEFFGPNISVNTIAEQIGTIPYEVLTSVSPRVKRVYYRE